jgi:hypothetical protein
MAGKVQPLKQCNRTRPLSPVPIDRLGDLSSCAGHRTDQRDPRPVAPSALAMSAAVDIQLASVSMSASASTIGVVAAALP